MATPPRQAQPASLPATGGSHPDPEATDAPRPDDVGAGDPGDPPIPHLLPLEIQPQPDDTTCGPTCLHAVYRFWGDPVPLPEVIATTATLGRGEPSRGTLAVMLGVHALARGYRASITTFNLRMFDPTWFDDRGRGEAGRLIDRLQRQLAARVPDDPRFREATEWYLRFLGAGGRIRMEELGGPLIARHLRAGRPVLTGLSATWLYRAPREFGPDDDPDDIRGMPAGHFVVLHGWDPEHRRVTVADPLADNPGFASQRYTVPIGRLIAAITLGVLTDDADLLLIEPRHSGGPA